MKLFKRKRRPLIPYGRGVINMPDASGLDLKVDLAPGGLPAPEPPRVVVEHVCVNNCGVCDVCHGPGPPVCLARWRYFGHGRSGLVCPACVEALSAHVVPTHALGNVCDHGVSE